jgi:FixJ family two-component response regulator
MRNVRRRCIIEAHMKALFAGARCEVSEKLAITERTVKFHVSGLFAKLGASNRTEAVRLAFASGLVRL